MLMCKGAAGGTLAAQAAHRGLERIKPLTTANDQGLSDEPQWACDTWTLDECASVAQARAHAQGMNVLTSTEIEQMSFAGSGEQLPGIQQAYNYLRVRGISPEYAHDLGLVILPARELLSRVRGKTSHDARLAIVFPHEGTEWWSARLVDSGLRMAVQSFDDLTVARGKMTCPPNEPPHAYLVPTLDWGSLQDNARIYIHESCIKAANGARLGRWSIGLNGVWGWTSRKHNIALVEELRGLPWKSKKLRPTIVFDSNYEDNWDVQAAASRLAAKLHEITGSECDLLVTPRCSDDRHQGFDDFAVSAGNDAATAWLDQEGTPLDIAPVEVLKSQLNSEVCVVRSLGRIAEQATGTLMTRQVFTDVNYADYNVLDDEDKVVNVPRVWLTDSRRTTVNALSYQPGEPVLTSDGDLNLWRGMGRDPQQGDVTPWLDLLENNVPDEGLRRWILQWMAYPLQNMGRKMNSFLLLFGPSGTGKDMILRPLHRIYGDNAIMVSNDELKSTFTSLYSAKQFIHANELVRVRQDNELVNQKIKMIVTSEKLTVNQKGQPEYKIRNVANLAITSNYVDCVKLDEDDRRACVVEWGAHQKVERRKDQDYWVPLVEWIDGDGAAAVYDYLLGVDMEGFDPMAWAPGTEAKDEVIDAGRSSVEAFVHRLIEDPDAELGGAFSGKPLFTAKELAVIHYGCSPDDLKPQQVDLLSKKLRSAGVPRANEGKNLKVAGAVARYWVIRRVGEDWSSPAKCQKALKA